MSKRDERRVEANFYLLPLIFETNFILYSLSLIIKSSLFFLHWHYIIHIYICQAFSPLSGKYHFYQFILITDDRRLLK